MQLFYTPDISGDTYTLNEEESRHCSRVLRLREGDSLYLTDGRGTLYSAKVADADQKCCKVEITGKQENYGKRPYSLTMAVAPTKNTDRYEWFLEKATEIGIDRIIPVQTEYSERKTIKKERNEKIVTSAVKQSLKAYLPVVDEISGFRDVVSIPFKGDKIIAHCYPSSGKKLLKDVVKPGRDVLIMIGPEGDFSPSEVTLALKNGFTEVSLGDTRLRTETAAIAACHTVALINQV